MQSEKIYKFIDKELCIKGALKLQVSLQTEEFGPIHSKIINSVNDPSIKQALWNSLAEEVIDEYEMRLRPKDNSIWGK